ncbi:hypothetical protein BDW67DRAFT_17924 [Aspergillus spinulosporus]
MMQVERALVLNAQLSMGIGPDSVPTSSTSAGARDSRLEIPTRISSFASRSKRDPSEREEKANLQPQTACKPPDARQLAFSASSPVWCPDTAETDVPASSINRDLVTVEVNPRSMTDEYWVQSSFQDRRSHGIVPWFLLLRERTL